MKKIIEEFGAGYLAIIAVGSVAAIIISCLVPGGILNTVIVDFMNSISG